ncbi:MAG: hypothetical protein K9I68_06290 [Bacteroidales bacterium]|nr:hypothetical protein [Bacteroidales bacterium]
MIKNKNTITIATAFIGILLTTIAFNACEDREFNNPYDENVEIDTLNYTNELPSEFPLEVGNAWEYERTYYENGEFDTSYLDTLYIAGKYQDYFLYSWDPKYYYSLVKNSDNKLVNYGSIRPNDTTFHDDPRIWAFYGKTGCLNSTSFNNYDNSNIDSLCISIDENREYFGEKWNTYIEERTFINDRDKRVMYYTKLGVVRVKYLNENNNLSSEIIMVEALDDLNPPELSNDTKENEIKLSKHHQIRLPDQSLTSK